MADRGVNEPAGVAPGRQRGGIAAFLAKAAGVLVLLGLAALIALWGVQRYVESRLFRSDDDREREP